MVAATEPDEVMARVFVGRGWWVNHGGMAIDRNFQIDIHTEGHKMMIPPTLFRRRLFYFLHLRRLFYFCHPCFYLLSRSFVFFLHLL